MPRGRRPYPDILTPREWEVLRLVREGLTNEQIATRLGISLAGARYHVSEIIGKLGVTTRREAAQRLTELEATRGAPRGLPALLAPLRGLPARLCTGGARKLLTGGALAVGIAAFALFVTAALVALTRDVQDTEQPQVGLPTPEPELGPVDFSQAVLGARYVTDWDLPDYVFEGRPAGADATGIEAVLPDVIAATLAADADAVGRSGQGFGTAMLRTVPQTPGLPVCEGDLCLWTVPFSPGDGGSEYWAVVVGGRALVSQGSPLGRGELVRDSSAAAFGYFVAVYERYADGTWSGELARVDLEDPRGDCCVLAGVSWESGGTLYRDAARALTSSDPAWVRLGSAMQASLPDVQWEEPGEGLSGLAGASAQSGGRSGWLVLRGFPYMATGASVFYMLRFDMETERLTVVESNLHRRWAGNLLDLDGDGTPEVLVNQADAFVFSGASGTEESMLRLLRWQDGELVDVPLEAPEGLPDAAASSVTEALRLAAGGFWTDAAALAGEAIAAAPQSNELSWVARRIQLIAMGRLLQADHQSERGPGNLAAPLLMLAGEYEGVVELMREFGPEELFDTEGMRMASSPTTFRPEYPLLGNEANGMSAVCLDRTATALSVSPERAAVHAVRSWCHALATPPGLAGAEAAMAEASRLAPDDAYYAAVLEWLRAYEGE